MNQQDRIVRCRHACEIAGDDDVIRTDLAMNHIQRMKDQTLCFFDPCSCRRFQSNLHDWGVDVWKYFTSHSWDDDEEKRERDSQVADHQRPAQPEYGVEIGSIKSS